MRTRDLFAQRGLCMGELPPLHMEWDFPSPLSAGVVGDKDEEDGEKGAGRTGGRRNTKKETRGGGNGESIGHQKVVDPTTLALARRKEKGRGHSGGSRGGRVSTRTISLKTNAGGKGTGNTRSSGAIPKRSRTATSRSSSESRLRVSSRRACFANPLVGSGWEASPFYARNDCSLASC